MFSDTRLPGGVAAGHSSGTISLRHLRVVESKCVFSSRVDLSVNSTYETLRRCCFVWGSCSRCRCWLRLRPDGWPAHEWNQEQDRKI